MILDEIILRNVGVFRGEHRIALCPPSKDKPVVLVGGMNGAGKTTLLETLQLALFGKLASVGRMSGLSYEEYLRRLINRQTPGRDGAAVEIAFRVHEEGQYRQYRVRRSWSESGKRIREGLDVSIDDKHDDVVSDTWQERVGRFIPHQMAHLFFFDGDRIEALADPQQSADVLRTAIDALLGVDLVDQLRTDLKALWRRKAKDQARGPDRSTIDEAEQAMNDLTDRREQLDRERARYQTELDRAQTQLESVEKQFKEQGGELAERQKDFEKQQQALLAERESIVKQLLDIAAYDLPLAMVAPLLKRVLERSQTQRDQVVAEQVRQAVESQLSTILGRLAEEGLPKKHLKTVESTIQTSFAGGESPASCDDLQPLPSIAEARLQTLLSHELVEQKKVARQLFDRHRTIESDLEQLDRLLAAVPDSDSLVGILEHRASLRQKIQDARTRLEMIDRQIAELNQQIETQSSRLDRLYRDDRAAQVSNSDLDRIYQHSEKVTDVLTRFRHRVTEKHTHRLEELILQSFQFLLRKQSLVHGIRIEPSTCKVTILDDEGRPMTPERLSMGERQLLAVAMLWGMAQASGRPLPVIIDTPLGRLDGDHRTNLVERYFPNASHQVILLSTDEEIDHRYYERMKSHIGHRYLVEFDDATQSSTVVPGYFFEESVA